MARYAVNLADLSQKANQVVVTCLVKPVMGGTVVVRPRQVDGVAVLLDCGDERAAAIVEVIRLKLRRHEMRCYVRKTDRAKTWKAV